MAGTVDPLGKITAGDDLLGKIRNTLSGFIGYFDRENRREADKLLRTTIANRYEQQWSRISAIQRQMMESGQLESVDQLEAAALKLATRIENEATLKVSTRKGLTDLITHLIKSAGNINAIMKQGGAPLDQFTWTLTASAPWPSVAGLTPVIRGAVAIVTVTGELVPRLLAASDCEATSV